MQQNIGIPLELQDVLDDLVKDEQAQTKRTQEEIASNIGISSAGLCKYLKGTSTPELENLFKIADYYNTSIDYLAGRVSYRTANESLVSTIKTTGLSEQAINNIKKLDSVQRSVLSYFLSHPYLAILLNSIYATAITSSVCEELKKSAEDERASKNLREDITTFFDLVLNDAEEKLVFEEYRRDKIAKNVFVATTREIFDNDKAIKAQAIQKRNFLLENQQRNNSQMDKSEEAT